MNGLQIMAPLKDHSPGRARWLLLGALAIACLPTASAQTPESARSTADVPESDAGFDAPPLEDVVRFAFAHGCSVDTDCASGMCRAAGRCTQNCNATSPCPAAWRCAQQSYCVCPGRAGDTHDDCNGIDDDCDGELDEEASCGALRLCAGSSGCICIAGYTECDHRCVNLNSDRTHCGRCDRRCRNDQVCSNGQCMCDSNKRACRGTCVDVSSNREHCGGCDQFCFGHCDSGTCRRPATATFGERHGCFLLDNGTLMCSGDNQGGQLGVDPSVTATTPNTLLVSFSAPSTVTSIASGSYRSCAIVGSPGRVACWGGRANSAVHPSAAAWRPTDVSTSTVRSFFNDALRYVGSQPLSVAPEVPNDSSGMVAVGESQACAVYSFPNSDSLPQNFPRRVVACWSFDRSSTCWHDSQSPVPVTPSNGILASIVDLRWPVGMDVRVYAGARHTCALADGRALCWGTNDAGQLGGCASPSGVVGAPVSCWVENSTNFQGMWRRGLTQSPANVNVHERCSPPVVTYPVDENGTPGRFTSLALGARHSCGVDSRNSIWCWGDNVVGQLGSSRAPGGPIAYRVFDLSGEPLRLAAGPSHTCVTPNNQSMIYYCWGSNEGARIAELTNDELAALRDAGVNDSSVLDVASDVLRTNIRQRQRPIPRIDASSSFDAGPSSDIPTDISDASNNMQQAHLAPGCAAGLQRCGPADNWVPCFRCPAPFTARGGIRPVMVIPGPHFTQIIDNNQGRGLCLPAGACPLPTQ